MNRRRLFPLAALPIMAAGLTSGVLAAGAISGSGGRSRSVSDMSDEERRESMHIRTLPSGETLGHPPVDATFEEEDLPDFIGAIATNGKLGYVRRVDLQEPEPSSREEAVQMTLQNLKDGPRSVPVYADDGRTVIGEYLTGGGSMGVDE
jgi:hypothetical protein